MFRGIGFGVLLLVFVIGCRISDREGLNPLPDNGPALTYPEMLNRVRGQATAALDAFYIDAWLDLEQAAQRLEQSARLLPKTTQIPEPLTKKIQDEADALNQDASKLLEAARAKSAPQANDAMQRINQRVRHLSKTDVSTDKK